MPYIVAWTDGGYPYPELHGFRLIWADTDMDAMKEYQDHSQPDPAATGLYLPQHAGLVAWRASNEVLQTHEISKVE